MSALVKSTLRWEPLPTGDMLAYSGRIKIAVVTKIDAGPSEGRWWWQISTIMPPFGWRSQGHTAHQHVARRCVEQFWHHWCFAGGLISGGCAVRKPIGP